MKFKTNIFRNFRQIIQRHIQSATFERFYPFSFHRLSNISRFGINIVTLVFVNFKSYKPIKRHSHLRFIETMTIMSISLGLFCSLTQFFVWLFDCFQDKKEAHQVWSFYGMVCWRWRLTLCYILVQSENTKLIIHNKTLYDVFWKIVNIPVVKQISFWNDKFTNIMNGPNNSRL